MRRYTFFFFLLLFSITTTAQTFQEIKSLLRARDFRILKPYIDSACNARDTSTSWELLRTVVSEYKEVVIGIHKASSRGGSSPNEYFLYSINLVASNEKIIFYEIKRKKIKVRGNPDFETEEVIKDENNYNKFKTSFRDVYHTDPDINDLFLGCTDFFLKSIVYGDHCGIAGTDPTYLQKLSAMIEAKKFSEIRKWLKSANAEKQLYALRAYRYLTSQGYELTDEENRLLPIVQRKQVMVNGCRGCSYMAEDFQSIVAEINATPAAELKPGKTYMFSYPAPMSPRNKTLAIIGMSLLFVVSIYHFIKYILERRKNARGNQGFV